MAAPPKPLTPRQLKFVGLYVGGASAAEAYVKAGYKARPDIARVNASKLLTKANVAAAVEEARQQGKGKNGITSEWWYARLKREATRNKNPAAARVQALKIIGQASGYVTENLKLSGDRDNPVQAEVKHDEHRAGPPSAAVVAGVLRSLGLPVPGVVRRDGAGEPVDQEGAGGPA